jgi:hypothetical protein
MAALELMLGVCVDDCAAWLLELRELERMQGYSRRGCRMRRAGAFSDSGKGLTSLHSVLQTMFLAIVSKRR